jgi:ASC-1-like (ASCH) protein
MKIHELKAWSAYFTAVRLGEKTHEVRVNDRGYAPGDALHLREWNPRTKKYTGDELLVRVTNITLGGNFGLPENLCCMSIKVLAWDFGVSSSTTQERK